MSALVARSPAYLGEQALDDVLDWLKAGLGVAVGMVVAALVNAWRKPSSHAELEKAINEAARGIVADLRTEVDRLQDRSLQCESENRHMAARIDTLEGKNRQLWQRNDSLEALLRREGIPVPERDLPSTFVVLETDRATVLKPEPRKPKE